MTKKDGLICIWIIISNLLFLLPPYINIRFRETFRFFIFIIGMGLIIFIYLK
jgi:hypothetical protein